MSDLGVCQHCARWRALGDDGRVVSHRIDLPRLQGGRNQRSRKRKCPGSGQLPRTRPGGTAA